MKDRNNPLKNFPPHSFIIIQASHAEFHHSLADIPDRYKTGLITYINNHKFVPLLKIHEKNLNRFVHLRISSLSELCKAIQLDTSSVLIIEHHLSWFRPDDQDQLMNFNDICRKRAQCGSPVVYITAIMDRWLLKLDGKADCFFQVGKIPLTGKRLDIREQTDLDTMPVPEPSVREKSEMYGQTSIRDW
ncbi:MAG: hypothetical protein GXY48_04075 [Methanomicrobiales archaeon]|nr:hypothetical protein [Methanomicrobiales archaeon]